jgi:hypothetical protein
MQTRSDLPFPLLCFVIVEVIGAWSLVRVGPFLLGLTPLFMIALLISLLGRLVTPILCAYGGFRPTVIVYELIIFIVKRILSPFSTSCVVTLWSYSVTDLLY